ncbi:MAG TPA: 2-hydroxychromene-2-carboxylate isomerase [Gammaproteobacteria bacterium]|jgi:2-hydroxychromene-2-carboxylate isomerase
MRATWYFDLISPFSYLHLKQFHRLPNDMEIEYVPVLFAAMLKHWDNRGPAEVPPKRVYMYRQLTWYAKHVGIPYKMPPAHPFNSLQALRLLIAAGPSRQHVETAFDMAWKEGRDLQAPKELEELARRLHIEDLQAAAADEAVKARLKANTEAAIARGVFGVPSFLLEDTLFWGQDSLEMMLDFLKDPALFSGAEMRRVSELPIGAMRKEVTKS